MREARVLCDETTTTAIEKSGKMPRPRDNKGGENVLLLNVLTVKQTDVHRVFF